MKIKALRIFSHYHLGTLSQGEVKVVKKEIGEMLVKMFLAEDVDAAVCEQTIPDQSEHKKGGKRANKSSTDGADKDASES